MLKREIMLISSKTDIDKSFFKDFSLLFSFSSFCGFIKSTLILKREQCTEFVGIVFDYLLPNVHVVMCMIVHESSVYFLRKSRALCSDCR